MLIEIMGYIGVFYYWTWFIWPFVLVISFSTGLANLIKKENASRKELILAAISLLIIIAGININVFN